LERGARSSGERADDYRRPSRPEEDVRREWEARLKRNKLLALIFVLVAIFGSIGWALYHAAGDINSSVASELGPTTGDAPAQALGSFHLINSRLSEGGKAELLMISALGCDGCAAERWALIKALGRFGTFKQLASDANGSSVPAFDLLNAQYSSYFVSFANKEIRDVNGNALQRLTVREHSIFKRYDPNGRLPFVVVGNYAMAGHGVSPDALAGLKFRDVQSALIANKHALFSREINAEANLITAFLCRADGGQPSVFCGRAPIRRIAARL
jgi:hypothetical protein